MGRLAKAQGNEICGILNELGGEAIDAFIMYQRNFRQDYPLELEGNVLVHLIECILCRGKYEERLKKWQAVDRIFAPWIEQERAKLKRNDSTGKKS